MLLAWRKLGLLGTLLERHAAMVRHVFCQKGNFQGNEIKTEDQQMGQRDRWPDGSGAQSATREAR